MQLMQRAASAYLTAGSPFGLFLMTALQSPEDAAQALMEREHITALGAGQRQTGAFSTAALTDPTQRTYLLLAYCMHPVVRHQLLQLLVREHESTADRMALLLAELQRQQATALRSAQGNHYLWTRGAAPVNYCDLELVALVAQALRGSGASSLLINRLDRLTTDPVAAVEWWAGTELYRRSNEEDQLRG
jgi:hypothetical protein